MNPELKKYLASQGLQGDWSSSLVSPNKRTINLSNHLLTGDLWGKNVMGVHGTSLELFLEALKTGRLCLSGSEYFYFHPRDVKGLRNAAEKIGVRWYKDPRRWVALGTFKESTSAFINDACFYAQQNAVESYVLQTLGIEETLSIRNKVDDFLEVIHIVSKRQKGYTEQDLFQIAKLLELPSNLKLLKSLYWHCRRRRGVLLALNNSAFDMFDVEGGDDDIRRMKLSNKELTRPDFKFHAPKGVPLSCFSSALPLGIREIKEINEYLPHFPVNRLKRRLNDAGFVLDGKGGYRMKIS